MRDLLQELKQRNVLRVVGAYVILAGAIAQAADIVFESFGAPDWLMRFVLILLAFGLPVAIALSWLFEITPEGIKKEEDVDRSSEAASSTKTRKINLLIVACIAVLAVASAYFITGGYAAKESTDSTTASYQQVASEHDSTKVRSIAVLPFTNRSSVTDTQYFVDGVHDELLTQLARISALKVISRTSVLEYRDTKKNMRLIGQELGVQTLMEGAVQRAGNRVRVIVKLVDASTDLNLWAHSFDRALNTENLFDIQSEIARAISDALAINLSPREKNSELNRSPTQSQSAYDFYLRARAIPFDSDIEELWRGIEYAKRAVELDPKFVLAMGQVAENYINIYWFSSQLDAHRDAAQQWIDRALSISPEDPRLQLILAQLLYVAYLDYDAALAALDKAQLGMPGESNVYLNRGAILRRSGRIDEAIEAFNQAQALNPRDASSVAHHIWTYVYTGDIASARRQASILRSLSTTSTVHLSYTKIAELFLLGDIQPIIDFVDDNYEIDFGSEDHLKIYAPFLARDYDAVLRALSLFPDPIAEQFNLWTHSYVRARVLHAQGNFEGAKETASVAVSELNSITLSMPNNARPVISRALMYAILGDHEKARSDIELAQQLYPLDADPVEGPNFIADGLRVLAIFADTDEVAKKLGEYLKLPTKAYYVDYLLLDPAFDRHRSDRRIMALQNKYSLRVKN